MNLLLEWRIARAKHAFLEAPPEEQKARWNIYWKLYQAKNRTHPGERKVFL